MIFSAIISSLEQSGEELKDASKREEKSKIGYSSGGGSIFNGGGTMDFSNHLFPANAMGLTLKLIT